MGTFAGHALPGSFFLVFAIWWTIQITRRYVACSTKSIPYYSTTTFPCYFICLGKPFEGIVKIFVTSIGMIAETFGATQPIWRQHAVGRMGDYHGIYVGDIEHISMYLFFFLNGVVDVLMARKNNILPPGLDYVASFMAFIAQYILFKFHGHGQAPLEMAIHLQLTYVILACAISVLIEYKYNDNILCSYIRALTVFLQGTWFYQVGFILYPPFPFLHHWDQGSKDNVMLATAIFTWHIVIDSIIIAIIAGITYCCSYKYFPVRKGTPEYVYTGLNSRLTNEQQFPVLSASESDGETALE